MKSKPLLQQDKYIWLEEQENGRKNHRPVMRERLTDKEWLAKFEMRTRGGSHNPYAQR